ncbi:DUF6474 family protein [Gordonia alkaliphila]|uniref:DUF6474 family protein n=1 Tax=Gordonia alkaliphila TaxID=1053547 RepID=UPI001FF6B047|nr:DUF6474 family protein [Gordonia alkaliphila]MCK0439093.1 DUF6474 family protein [Gordonia alkaliphila]
MGLLSSRRASRVQRKAEAKIRKAEEKAVKTRVQLEAKVGAQEEARRHKKALKTEHKYQAKAHKAERKTTKSAGKAQQKVAAAEAKTVAAQAKVAEKQSLLNPAKVRRYLTVGRILAPIAGPILYRGAVAARSEITALQARRAGVPAATLTQFGGPSAALRARISTAQETAQKVGEADSTPESAAFVNTMLGRLNNLVVAADAADTMPPAQRRAAQRAISNELTAIDNDLLARLNVHP